MISYGPFGDPVRAKIGLHTLLTRKLGVTRAMNMGIVWQDGPECQFLQPCTPYPNGHSELMVVTADHVKKPPPKLSDISSLGLAWDTINTASDVVFSDMAITAFTAALAVVFDAAAGVTVGAGAIVMLAFTAVEAADALVLMVADGIMTYDKFADKIDGGNRAKNLDKNKYYHFIETWGPIIALPAVAHDIYLAFNIPRDARLLTDLRAQMLTRAKEVLREMRATDAFIGAEGDLALRDSYAFLKESVRELHENLTDIKRDFRKLARVGLPADAIGLTNTIVHWRDIADGAMVNLSQMATWLGQGAAYAERTMAATGSFLSAGTARANANMPRQMGSTYQAARFGGIHFTPAEARVRIASTFPITMHLIGGTHAKRIKGKP